MIQHIEAMLETYFPPRADRLRIRGVVVTKARMTDPMTAEDHWTDLRPGEDGIGVVMPGQYDELQAALAFERALWRFDLALASFRERVQVN